MLILREKNWNEHGIDDSNKARVPCLQASSSKFSQRLQSSWLGPRQALLDWKNESHCQRRESFNKGKFLQKTCLAYFCVARRHDKWPTFRWMSNYGIPNKRHWICQWLLEIFCFENSKSGTISVYWNRLPRQRRQFWLQRRSAGKSKLKIFK